MQAPVYSLSGELQDKTILPKNWFAAGVAPAMLAQAARVYLANQRQASAKTLTRGEVKGSTRKIFRQKGTGRARHGAIRAPIFVGGGISHGPDGQQNFALTLPKKMKKTALTMALGAKAGAKQVAVVTGANGATGKSKQAKALREKMQMAGEKVLLVSSVSQKKIDLGWRNLERVTVAHTNNLNTYIVLANKRIVFTKEALGELGKR